MRAFKFIPPLMACAVLCFSTGCAGLGDLHKAPDGSGGYVLYEMRSGTRHDLAFVDASGEVTYAPDIQRGAGGVLQEGVEAAAHGGHRHREAWEWLLCFTIIYLIIILIEMAIEAAEDD